MALRSDADYVRLLKIRIAQAQRQYGPNMDIKGNKVIALILVAAIWAFFEAYWGTFDFSGQIPAANLVVFRNSDLYQISFDLFLLLAFSVFLLVWGAKIIAVRKSEGRQRLKANFEHK